MTEQYRKEILAAELGNDRTRLFRRLTESIQVLVSRVRPRFREYQYDFERKCLVGTAGGKPNGFRLEWRIRHWPELPESYGNQQTTTGTVICVCDESTND